MRAAELGFDVDVLAVHALALEVFLLPPSLLEVDLVGELSLVRQEDDGVVAHVDEAAVNGRVLPLPILLLDASDSDVERTQEGSVVVQEGDVPAANRAADH